MPRKIRVVVDGANHSSSSRGKIKPSPGLPKDTKDLIIYEADLFDGETGVHHCERRLDRMIRDLANKFARQKAKALKLKPFYVGWRSGTWDHENSKNDWDNARHCWINVYIRAVVYFERPAGAAEAGGSGRKRPKRK